MPDLAPEIVARLRAFPRVASSAAGKRAAVALVLLDDPDQGTCFLLTRRASTLSAHAGQFALPGGRLDAGESALDAALRELYEEMGLRLPSSSLVGYLDDYVTRSGYVITPVVVWAGRLNAPLAPNPAEVAHTFTFPIIDLDVEPRFLAIPESTRPLIQLPILGGVMHAPTAALLYQFREVGLHGRTTWVDELEQPAFASSRRGDRRAVGDAAG